MKQKRILIIASLAESLVNFRGPLIKALCDAGHEVHVAAPSITEKTALCDCLKSIGATPHDIFLQRTGMNPVSDLKSLLVLISIMRSIRPQHVLSYTIKPVVWGGIAARFVRDIEFYALITGLGYAFIDGKRGERFITRRLAEVLYRKGLRHATGVIFQNPDDAREFLERGLLPSRVTPKMVDGSGVDTETFSMAALPSGPISFLLIARLLGDKGIYEFAEAAKMIRAENSAVEFHLVGPADPNPNGIPVSTVKKWHDDGILVWHGGLSDVRPAISSAHVYVLPSYREGTPRTVIEAMSMGRPVITTDAPGCRETVMDGVNGFLVPIRDAETLADAMRKFIESPDLISQMGAQSRIIAEEKYDVRKVNAQMMEAMGL